MASPDQKRDAIEKVNAFRARNPSGVWLNINAADFADSLVTHINNPDSISSDQTNLCGPAAFIRFLADGNPEAYVQIGIGLFETGRTVLMGTGAVNDRVVTAGYDLRNHPVPRTTYMRPDGSVGGIDEANWVILASMRDSDNWFFDYQHEGDSVAGMTLPHTMENWLRMAGFTTIINEANVWFTKDEANAVRASELRKQGYKVTLLISANMLSSKDEDTSFWHGVGAFFASHDEQDDASWAPDHWVGLDTDITLVSDPNLLDRKVQMRVHSWGHYLNVPEDPAHPLTVRNFLQNYYGFIACKY